jgi:hypothetical protein
MAPFAGLKMPFQAAGCRRIGIEKISYGGLLRGTARASRSALKASRKKD